MTVPPPNRVPWPPLIFGGLAVVALGLGQVAPGPEFLDERPWRLLGWLMLGLGIGLDALAMVTMWQHEANILPHRPATALVTTGIFAWTRNPIYLGNTIALVGLGLVLCNGWLALAAAVAAPLVLQLAILREERHLALRFGAAWIDYQSRTRRWFGRHEDP